MVPGFRGVEVVAAAADREVTLDEERFERLPSVTVSNSSRTTRSPAIAIAITALVESQEAVYFLRHTPPVTPEDIAEILSLERELSGVEFKGPGPRSDRRLFAKVILAMLGMANRRDGGRVIVGVTDISAVLTPVGLSADDVATWRHDDVADGVAAYADPSLEFQLDVVEHEGKSFVIITVHQFSDIPVLCKRDFDTVLRAGACYVRTRRKPETTEIPSQSEMRDLLELATEIRLRAFLATARRASVELTTESSDRELFDEQRRRLVSNLIEKIRSRGHYDIVIRPTMFEADRVAYTDLAPIIERSAVHVRGWSVPYVNLSDVERDRTDAISQHAQWEHNVEAWRFFTSGQFTFLKAIPSDWRDESSFWPAGPEWQPGVSLGVLDTVFRYTEVFELAARLALTAAGAETMHVSIDLVGLEGRHLEVDSNRRAGFFMPPTTGISHFPWETEAGREELIAAPGELALLALEQLFARFGWPAATLDLLRELQSDLERTG